MELTAHDIITRANELQAARLEIIGTLAELQTKLTTLRNETAAVHHQHREAVRHALKLGWTQNELKQLGVDITLKPSPTSPHRPRRKNHPDASAEATPTGYSVIAPDNHDDPDSYTPTTA